MGFGFNRGLMMLELRRRWALEDVKREAEKCGQPEPEQVQHPDPAEAERPWWRRWFS